MRKLFIATVTLIAACLIAGYGAVPDREVAAHVMGPPNIIFILTDDLDERAMLNFSGIRREIGAGVGDGMGATFENAYVTHSLCCPARASMLTGMYSHNHQVLGNKPPAGGVEKFRSEGHESSNIVKRLDSEGYRTVFIGKYMNGYNGGYVPPGWDRWYGYQGYYRGDRVRFLENGRSIAYNPERYHDTYIMRDYAVEEIHTTRSDAPLFMWLSFNAPHGPSPYPDEHASAFEDARVPRVPSIEEDVSDKPEWVRKNSGYEPDDEKYRDRLRSMLSVEESIQAVIQALKEEDELENTYLVFTSDNGLHMGEHGLQTGKKTPYEEDISIPLYIRGPGVPAGRVYEEMALNIDLAPTFADWAGAPPLRYADGRSLDPLFSGGAGPWRNAFLIEHWQEPDSYAPYVPTYRGIHTREGVYIEYASGKREMYDLLDDPYQLNGSVRDLEQARNLSARLTELKNCAGTRCWAAENP